MSRIVPESAIFTPSPPRAQRDSSDHTRAGGPGIHGERSAHRFGPLSHQPKPEPLPLLPGESGSSIGYRYQHGGIVAHDLDEGLRGITVLHDVQERLLDYSEDGDSDIDRRFVEVGAQLYVE